MNLQDLTRALRRGWWTILVLVILGAAGSLLLSALQTPLYRTTTTLTVSVGSSGTPTDRQNGAAFAVLRAPAYAAYVPLDAVLRPAAARLPGVTVDSLRDSITASARDETSIIDISAVSPNPQLAANEANEVARSLTSYVGDVEPAGRLASSRVTLVAAQTASPPLQAESPRPRRDLAIGMLVGLALGVAVVVVGSALSTRLTSPRDTALTSGLVPVPIPEIALHRRAATALRRREAVRGLRTDLRVGLGSRATVVVSAAGRTSGITDLGTDLAIAFGETGASVLVIHADVRLAPEPPRGRRRDGEANIPPGLAEVVRGEADLQRAAVPSGQANVWTLPIGRADDQTAQTFSSAGAAAAFRTAAERFDYVVVLAPPVLERSEAVVLAAQSRLTLLVCEARTTRRAELLLALESLSAAGVSAVKLVLTAVAAPDMQPSRVPFAADEQALQPARPPLAILPSTAPQPVHRREQQLKD